MDAATTPAAPAAAPDATKGSTSNTAPQQEAAPQEWSDKDDAELIERLKRAPWAKAKVKGKEQGISSKDDFLALIADAQRGRGANQLVEQTKKEKAEAEAAKREAASVKEALEAARRGDRRALEYLGLVPPEEAQRQQQEWEALPPEVRAVVEENQRLAKALKEREEAETRTKAEELAAQKKAAREAALGKAKEYAKTILADVREDMHDVELPEVLQAMHVLHEAGAKLGVDYGPEHVKALVERMRGEALDGRLSRLKPDVAVRKALPHLKALAATPESLEAALGEDFEPLARAISARLLARARASKAAKAQQAAQAQPTQPKMPERQAQPLPPFRWAR